MEPQESFINRLLQIRSNLMDAVRANRALNAKFVGPRPSDTKEIGKTPDSIDILLVELQSLSTELVKMASLHHETLGGFAPGNPVGGTTDRAYA
jgi:hypothetical protein